jgi:hypothetical protein
MVAVAVEVMLQATPCRKRIKRMTPMIGKTA